METLKSLVPDELHRMIAESTPANLPSTCSALLDLFHSTSQFHKLIKDLVETENGLCSKNKETALEQKRKGNQLFSKGQYSMAVSHYSQALRAAPIDVCDMENSLVATLYINRASSLYKLGLLVECLRDCDRALFVSPGYAKAWYRRGKTNSSLKDYECAICDLEVAMCLEPSASGQRQIQIEIQEIMKSRDINRSLGQQNGKKDCATVESQGVKLQCVYSPSKGRGMASEMDIPESSLIHSEEPYAMIVSKHCRETHCHFCLNELPADVVPCSSCLISLYCSQDCQARAGGLVIRNYPENCRLFMNLSGDLEDYVARITRANPSDSGIKPFAEHGHECRGAHWPRVLPSEIVLAGRIVAKSIYQRDLMDSSDLLNTLDLSHNYAQMSREKKMELHIYAIILLKCMEQSDGSEVSVNGHTISQVIIIFSQIKVNSMAVVRMKYSDGNGSAQEWKSGGVPISNVEQVRVGQAIYLAGSLFNHSCQPNIHSYFLSRTLYIRSTESVAAGSPLELSYGPQVGQWDCKDRQQLLQEEYSFNCHCRGCTRINFSDLVLDAFRCVDPYCFGVVLDSCAAKYEGTRMNSFRSIEATCSNFSPQVENPQIDVMEMVGHALKLENGHYKVKSGCCLNCGTHRDLASSREAVKEAGISIERLQDALDSGELPAITVLPDALRSLSQLRSTLHKCNKRIAEVEDILSQAFCLVQDFPTARNHCKASIEILEKLYGHNHIVIGYELLKLSSIELTSGDHTYMDSINRLTDIFSRYFGSHLGTIFPHWQSLKKEAQKLGW